MVKCEQIESVEYYQLTIDKQTAEMLRALLYEHIVALSAPELMLLGDALKGCGIQPKKYSFSAHRQVFAGNHALIKLDPEYRANL